jgi:transposase
MDMSPTYALVFNDLVPRAVQTVDKFHVMKYVYDVLGAVRKRIVVELQSGKIQRFITQNYGLKDKDFFFYRTAGYFSSRLKKIIHDNYPNYYGWW